ncbi:HAD-IB family phosphatase [Halodesulfovibrio sp.]|uniref:HAD-IB family phosphatase n=1 Tax=Halodesulfovibrio sp. TaxID=1912772 RepID=UPI0025BD728F|nr:HAD-IB family phosphatase [Halodesulfovibrio sp.]
MFDLDGTVTAQETLPAIAKHFNVLDEINDLTRQTIEGRIPFVEGFIRRINVLKRFSVAEVNHALEDIKLHKMLVEFINSYSSNCRIVTGNLDCWVASLLTNVSCAAETSKAVVQDDRLESVSSIINKADVVLKYQQVGYQVVFVGEGNNDAEAIRVADIGVAFGAVHWPSASVMQVASHAIFDEDELCRFLRQLL